jgi:hypothetical protein
VTRDNAPHGTSIGWETSRGNHSRVPRFSAGGPSAVQVDRAAIVTSIITILFGAVHCFAWSYDFPSGTERLLWRVASLITTALPIVWTAVYSLSLMDDLEDRGGKRIRYKAISGISAIVVPVYLIGRAMLLVIAVTSLRSLPYDAYKTVRWITFIPHI